MQMLLETYLDIHGISQAEFARIIGTKKSNINRYISGIRSPRPAMAEKIERVTKGKVTWHDLREPAVSYGKLKLNNSNKLIQEAGVDE